MNEQMNSHVEKKANGDAHTDAISFRGKTVLAVSAGLPTPTISGTPKELVIDAQGSTVAHDPPWAVPVQPICTDNLLAPLADAPVCDDRVAGVTTQPEDKFDLVVCASAGPLLLDAAMLGSISASVRPGGSVYLQEIVRLDPPLSDKPLGAAARVRGLRDAAGLRRAVLFAGLARPDDAGAPAAPVPVTPAAASAAVAALYPELASAAATGSCEATDALAALAAVLAPQLGLCTLQCTRPDFNKGRSFSLRSRMPPATPSAPPPPPSTTKPCTPAEALANPWAAIGDSGTAAVDLVDEDDLLAEEDLATKEANTDCGTSANGKRKACKNCSCGLRELLEGEDGESRPPPASKSACGNCALGDAYRCAGCPHLGKPAFVDGSDVKLAEAMMAPGTLEVPADASRVKLGSASGTKGGVVQLSLDDTMDVEF